MHNNYTIDHSFPISVCLLYIYFNRSYFLILMCNTQIFNKTKLILELNKCHIVIISIYKYNKVPTTRVLQPYYVF